MRVIAKILFTLFFLIGLPGNTLAITQVPGDQDIQAMIKALDADIAELEFLNGELANARNL